MENKYIHVERLKSPEVDGILNGVCNFYPKLDGANASVEMDSEGNILARSRKRVLNESENLKGFYQYVKERESQFKAFFSAYPEVVIFGEWLVPHTIKTYKPEAWRKFYVFDYYDKNYNKYLDFEVFKQIFAMDYEIDVEYVPLLDRITNPTPEQIEAISKCSYDVLNEGVGEGIVIKNYKFVNKFGRQAFAKVVNEHFSDKHDSKYKANKPRPEGDDFEKKLVYKYLTDEYVLKEYNKLGGDHTTFHKLIQIVFEEFVRDYISEIISKYKNPTINFKTLRKYVASYVVNTIIP